MSLDTWKTAHFEGMTGSSYRKILSTTQAITRKGCDLHAWPARVVIRRKDPIEQCRTPWLFPMTFPLSHSTTLQPLLLRHELPTTKKTSYVRDLSDLRKEVSRLQDVSGKTEETNEGSARESESLVATWGGDGGWGGCCRGLDAGGSDALGCSSSGGGVGIHWGWGGTG